jgi:hypothetical protein
LFQLGFAIFSEGNAEFMIMLPMLFILIVNGFFQFHTKILFYIALPLLLWNISFGLFPNHHYDFQNHTKTIDFINSHKGAVFILSDDVLVQNRIYYQTGKNWDTGIYKSPASLGIRDKEITKLKVRIDSCLAAKIAVYTDCIDEPVILSRKTYLQKNENEVFFNQYALQKADSIAAFAGMRYFYKILEKGTLKTRNASNP